MQWTTPPPHPTPALMDIWWKLFLLDVWIHHMKEPFIFGGSKKFIKNTGGETLKTLLYDTLWKDSYILFQYTRCMVLSINTRTLLLLILIKDHFQSPEVKKENFVERISEDRNHLYWYLWMHSIEYWHLQFWVKVRDTIKGWPVLTMLQLNCTRHTYCKR